MENLQSRDIATTGGSHHITAQSVAGATAAGVAVGGPLLALMSFSFLATVTLFLLASPLLLISSPLLFGAVTALVVALAGFGAAAAMAVAGLCTLAWTARQLGLSVGVVERMAESAGVRMKELQDRDWGGHLRNKAHDDDSSDSASVDIS